MVVKFFLLSNTFLQYFVFIKQTIVFIGAVPQSDLPILWQASLSLLLLSTSTYFVISTTVLPKSLSLMSSGMPEMTILFLLSYFLTLLMDNSKETTF